VKSIKHYFEHSRISLFILAITFLSLGALGLGLTSIQASNRSAYAQGREVRVIGGDAFAGQTTNVSVALVAQGDENTVRFSLNFDPAVLSDPVVVLGSGAAGATLGFNAGQAASGNLGIAIALPSGQTFAVGQQQIATVIFTVASSAPAGPSQIAFGDSPVARAVFDASAVSLTAAYSSGAVNVIQPNPVPMLVGLSPFSAASGSPSFTLNVNGANFVDGARVRWNGSPRTTTFVSSTKLAALIPASDIANPGTATVSVVNPAPGGGISGGLIFTINNGAPTISGVTPNSATVGSSDVTITVNGTGFLSGSKVRFNSTELATTFGSDAQLTATVPASSLTTGGVASITAVNPAPGGGTSNSATFTVNSQVPTIANLSPGFAIVGGQQFTLTVNGTGFASNSVVRWNDSDRMTSFVSATRLTATIPATDIASQGTANVKVSTPAPGGGTSNSAPFFIGAQFTSVSAASFQGNELARESILAGFGLNLATQTQFASAQPLPTNLAGTTVRVVDSAGTDRLAPLFAVSSQQVNYQAPPGAVDGLATVVATSGDGKISVGALPVTRVAPGVFTASGNGLGVAAAVILRARSGSPQTFESMVRFDSAQGKFVSVPVDLGPATDDVFLVLFCTGLRFRSSMTTVSATIGGTNAQVGYADLAPGLTGLDQANIRIPRSLVGRDSELDVVLTVDGKVANTVKLYIK